MISSSLKLYKRKCAFLVPVRDGENARAVMEALEGYAVLAVIAKRWPTAKALAHAARNVATAAQPISLALGEADPTQGRKVLEVALLCQPAHINQPFPVAGYAVGALAQVGLSQIIVNGLVKASGEPGQVTVSTGERSNGCTPAIISAHTAAAMLREAGVTSIKFQFPRGPENLAELAILTKAATSEGIELIEPSGGINFNNVGSILMTCLEAGAKVVLPHVFSAVMDKETGLTIPEQTRRLLEIAASVLE